MDVEDVVIIGAGPSGIAAAIQLKRYGINPILIEKNKLGGLLLNANKIENYLGFPKGITGTKIVNLLKKQLDNFGVQIHFEEVIEIDYQDFLFVVTTNLRTIRCITAVLAIGTTPNIIEDFDIPDIAKDRTLYEIVPILRKRNKLIAIIGAGDAAFDYALNLSKNNVVSIFNRSSKLKCLPTLNDECNKNPNIKYFPDTIIEKVDIANDKIILNCMIANEQKMFLFDFLVIAIGRKENFEIISDNISENFHELVNAKRLFLIGDVQNGKFRQLSLCVGDGIKAAMEIANELDILA